jgi:single-strand DNA-binding protein
MAGVASITIVGNLAADPELRYGASGKAQCTFRVISTRRRLNRDTQQWEDAGQLAPRCVAWEALAENIAETLTKGMRVVVQGTLEERRYEDRQGNPRTSLDLSVDDIGPSLRNATAKVTKAARGSSGGFQAGGGGGGGFAGNQGYAGGGNGGYQSGPAGGFGGESQNRGGFGGGYDANPDNPWDEAGAGFPDEPPF